MQVKSFKVFDVENLKPVQSFCKTLSKILLRAAEFPEPSFATENNFSKSTFDLYKLFKIDPGEIIQLDAYFLEYFVRLLKRLRDINFEDVQKQRNLVI